MHDNSDHVAEELKSAEKRSISLGSYFHFKNLGQFLHFTHKQKTPTKDNQNTRKHLLSLAGLALVILCLLGLPCSILMQDYPDHVNTFKDKMYYHYGWANEELCKALIEKGKNARTMNLTELAKDYYLAASDIKTKDNDSFLAITEFFLEIEDYDQTQKLCEIGFTLFPSHSEYYEICAWAMYYWHKGKRKIIFDFFSDKVELGDETSFMESLMNPLFRREFYEEMSKSWDLGSLDTFEYKLGYGEPDAASRTQSLVLLAEKAIELNPDSKRASFVLMWYYWDNNKYDESIAWAKKHLDVHPESATSYYMLCACYLAKNMEVEAKKFYALGCKIDPINEVRTNLENKYYEIKYDW